MTKQKLAYLISRLLGPAPMICLLWLVTALRSGIGFWKALWVYPLIFVFSIGIPLLVTTFMVKTKRVDIEWSKLEDRKKLIPLALYALASGVILTYLLTTPTLFHLSLLLTVIIILAIAVSSLLHFKISGHIILATITVSGIILFFGFNYIWLYIILLPIIWARYTLKVHTLPQLIAGFILPTVIILLALLFFGWPQIP